MFDTPITCAVIGRTRHKMMQAEIAEAAKQGAKLIELRMDFLARSPDYKRLLDKRPCPMIATFRRQADGGRWTGTEEQRLMLIRQAVVAGFDYIDLESDIIEKIPRFGNVKRIVSYHNIQETPEKLELIYQQMCQEDADIVKISVTAQHPADNLRVLALLKNAPKPTVAVCMGDLGTCSRLLSLKLGAPFTYGAFNRERQIAPGILAFKELQTTYNVERINAQTRVIGVVGDPIGHSLSPLIHNAALQHLGINALYLPFRVPRGELGPFLKALQEFPVDGYSVTIPHKEAAAKLALLREGSVTAMGAANTLLATSAGFCAANTDAQAAFDSLRAHLPMGPDGFRVALDSRRVMILGAGGVARAVAYALRQENVAFVITNRTEDRGQALADEMGCLFVEWSARHNVECDTVINCTSVGMHPNVDESPLHHSFLNPELMVFDTIYTPETTLLIREARERGCHVLTGVDMFVRQAALQFELFTGRDAPLDVMTARLRKALSPLTAGSAASEPIMEDTAEIPSPVPPAIIEEASPVTRSRLLFLIGYRGAGKTTVAQLLAGKLGWNWVDADALLEERAGRSIREIFATDGEAAFRAMESTLLDELSGLEDYVIATGGGAVMSEENRARLTKGLVVWLKAPADLLWQRMQADPTTSEQRPDLAQGGLTEVEELLAARAPTYEACQHFTADAEPMPEEVADAILAWFRQG